MADRGYEFWSSYGGFLSGSRNQNPCNAVTGKEAGSSKPSMNFRVYWDGDEFDELLDGTSIGKYGKSNLMLGPGLSAIGAVSMGNSSSCNGTKATPCLSADIFGDWREEIILWSKDDSSTLNIYSTAYEIEYRFPTLMHDHTYRMAVAWQNTAYNQPPHLGFYLPDFIGGYQPTGIRSLESGDKSKETGDCYNLMGVRVKHPEKGIYIDICGMKTIIGLLLFAQEVISLAGSWDLSIGDSVSYDDYAILPGSLLTNGKGDKVTVDTRWTGSTYDSSYYFNPWMEQYRQEDNLKFPFFLTPERHFVGMAWYKRSVYIPKDWSRNVVTLYLERPHIETRVYVNGQFAGQRSSLSTPHQYDVTKFIVPGQRNIIAIGVYNGIENVCVGQDSHSVTDQTQGNWNGITGQMELRGQSNKIFIRQVKVNPEPVNGVITATLEFGGEFNPIYYDDDLMVLVDPIPQGDSKAGGDSFMWFQNITGYKMKLHIPTASMTLWDEFNPQLYRLGLTRGDDYYETTFGIRKVRAEGRQLYINDRQLWLRGTVENCCFPETGYPPTDEASSPS